MWGVYMIYRDYVSWVSIQIPYGSILRQPYYMVRVVKITMLFLDPQYGFKCLGHP